MRNRSLSPRATAALAALAPIVALAAVPRPGAARPASDVRPVLSPASIGAPLAGDCAAAPEEVALRPTQNAPGGRGRMVLVQADSPYGIAVDAEGRHRYDIRLEVERLRRRDGASYVAWAATPELDRVARLGVLGPDNRVEATIVWNKFLVFVSEEAGPDGERWAGPILLTGLSPSGRMHTMAGHGPFEGVACADYY